MASFKVALIDKMLDEIPAWVPGELDGAGLEFVYGHCHDVHDLLALAGDCHVLWIYGGSRLASRDNLAKLDNCLAVIRSGSGVDRIDVEAATDLGIVVVNTPHAHDDAVSDHTIALMFAVGRRIVQQDAAMRGADWSRRESMLPLWKLRGKTLGLIGFGNIARYLVRKLRGFDLRVLVYDPYVDPALLLSRGAEAVTLDLLLTRSDVVSIHTPLTAETHHLIDASALQRMKRTAILINTARGPLIDEAALVQALSAGWIAGAGLDVFEVEPTRPDHPLFSLENVVVTPHTAGFSDESIDLTWRYSVEACIDLAQGFWPRSYVNRAVVPRRALQTKVR